MQAESTTPDPRRERAECEAVHRVYLRLLAELLRQQGQDPTALLPSAGGDFVDAATLRERLPSINAASGLARPGLALGAAADVSVHGRLGLAMASAATLGDALQVLCRYSGLRGWALRPQASQQADGELLVELFEDAELGPARGFVLDAWAMLVQRALETLAGRSLDGLRWDPPLLPPGDAPGPWPQGARPSRLRLGVPAALLTLPCLAADAETHALACADCERQLNSAAGRRSLSAALRAELLRSRDGFPSADQLAARLGLSRRSLFRQLSAEGLRWQGLLDEERRRRACAMLGDSNRPVADIAAELGFDDASSFSRSFRRWTGRSPRAWRQSRG